MSEANIKVQPGKLGIEDSFNFRCGKDIECFNKCCRDINLFLTPYDIVRMKRRLNMPSGTFLKIYTFPLFPEEVGHPVILMKMLPDESKYCPFVSDEGCMIYTDRPWSCRSFPLDPGPGHPATEFELVKRDFCLGFNNGRSNSVRKWIETQNIGFYEEMNEEWKKVTHNENFNSRNLLQGNARDMFFLGSYNIDEFRNLISKGDFLKYFVIDGKLLKKIKSSEAELLMFAFRWLRHVLFGEETLKRR